MDRQKKKMLKASLFHHRDDISDWIREDPETEHFSGFEIIAAVLAFAAALATIDKGLESVDSLIERVKRLYRYVRHDQEKAEVEESPGLTEGERILAMVFDAYLDNRKGLSTEELAGRCGVSAENASEILNQFEAMRIVRKRDDDWIFSTRGPSQ